MTYRFAFNRTKLLMMVGAAALTGILLFAAGVFTGTPEDAEMMAYGAWALVQGLGRFERVQRPAVSDKVKARQRELLTIYVNGLKTDWSPEG